MSGSSRVYILITLYGDGDYDCELFDEMPTFGMKECLKNTPNARMVQLRVGNVNGGDSLLLEEARFEIVHIKPSYPQEVVR